MSLGVCLHPSVRPWVTILVQVLLTVDDSFSRLRTYVFVEMLQSLPPYPPDLSEEKHDDDDDDGPKTEFLSGCT